MAPPTVQILQRLAAETGYRLDTLEKVLRLLELLVETAQGADGTPRSLVMLVVMAVPVQELGSGKPRCPRSGTTGSNGRTGSRPPGGRVRAGGDGDAVDGVFGDDGRISCGIPLVRVSEAEALRDTC